MSPNLDTEAYDGVIDVTSDEALETARKIGKMKDFQQVYLLAQQFGQLMNWQKTWQRSKVLALCADNGERYLSTELYDY